MINISICRMLSEFSINKKKVMDLSPKIHTYALLKD